MAFINPKKCLLLACVIGHIAMNGQDAPAAHPPQVLIVHHRASDIFYKAGLVYIGYLVGRRLASYAFTQLTDYIQESGSPADNISMEKPPQISFNDVIGADEAKAALGDIVQLLKDPEPYAKLGARLPKGILLEGKPGNGKTLLAKALAGEADAHFIPISGSEFANKYMGGGVKRVRNLFKKARRHTPCIIFIDEMDGIGKRTEADQVAATDENKTITELLTQMDGIATSVTQKIVMIGATNHRDLIDPALLRSGRFDTIVTIESPTQTHRKAILELYAQKIKAAPAIDFEELAKKAEGFSGADLANLVNKAALLAARKKADAVEQNYFDEALEQICQSQQLAIPDSIRHMYS